MNRYLIGVSAIAVMFLSGCTQEKAASKSVRPVRTVIAQLEQFGETIVQTGEVRPQVETAMSFRTDGQLVYRIVNGTNVKAGDVVARLDPIPAQNGLLTAQAELSTAQAALDLAQVTADRSRDLFAKNIASKAQMQEADANLATAKAKAAATQAALANAQETLSYTQLKAGRDGIIAAVGANEGQVVTAGLMVATLISDDERDAVFDAPETLINMSLENADVEIALVSDSNVKAKGRVREVTPSADPVTRTYRVKVALDDGGRKMPFGAAVTGSLVLSPKTLVSIPASALTEDGGRPAVFVVDPSLGKLKYRDVRVERYTDTAVLVAEGLSNGDVVATSGVSKLRDGEAVTLEGEPAK